MLAAAPEHREHASTSRILDPRLHDSPPQYATAGLRRARPARLHRRAARARPGDSALVPSGIAIHLADPGLAAIVLPRSGLGHKHGIVLGNLVGLIDSDYQGQIMVSMLEPLARALHAASRWSASRSW